MKNVVDCKTIHNDFSPYVLPPNLGCPCATDFDKLNIGDEPSSQAQPVSSRLHAFTCSLCLLSSHHVNMPGLTFQMMKDT